MAAQIVTPWCAALLEHPFLRNRAPALRELDAAGTPTIFAHKAPAAAAAAAAAVGYQRSRSDRDGEEDTRFASYRFELLLWLTTQVHQLRCETKESMESSAKGGSRLGCRARLQPAAGANSGSNTAPGVGQAASQLWALGEAHGKTEPTRLLGPCAAKVVSIVLASLDALAQKVDNAVKEDLLLPVLTRDPDTLMVRDVDVIGRRADEKLCVPLAQRKRLFGSGTQRTTDISEVDRRTVLYCAPQTYQFGGAAASFLMHLVKGKKKKDLLRGTQAKHKTLYKLSICFRVVPLSVGIKTGSLSVTAFRNLSTRAAA